VLVAAARIPSLFAQKFCVGSMADALAHDALLPGSLLIEASDGWSTNLIDSQRALIGS
jgi:hypothetical protein